MVDVTVVVPTFFANKMTTNCIDSLLKNTTNPKIVLYKNDIGWLKACNKIMQETRDDIILLNDDTYVVSDIISEMRDAAYADEKIGIVGGMALSPNGEMIINFGIYMGVDGNSAHIGFGQQAGSYTKPESRKSIEGSCMYIKREVLDKIGYFDEGFGMGYREEVDLCFRAREAGYKVISAPNAKYIHFVSQTNSQLGITNNTFDYFMSKWSTKLKLGKV
jgi:GT2 family glycosyltransferase